MVNGKGTSAWVETALHGVLEAFPLLPTAPTEPAELTGDDRGVRWQNPLPQICKHIAVSDEGDRFRC